MHLDVILLVGLAVIAVLDRDRQAAETQATRIDLFLTPEGHHQVVKIRCARRGRSEIDIPSSCSAETIDPPAICDRADIYSSGLRLSRIRQSRLSLPDMEFQLPMRTPSEMRCRARARQ
jgi:hypothetical protein